MSVVEKVQHYQRSIEKCWDNEERMMHCISKLYQLPVTVQHLRDTGVGRTVNSLRKFDGGVGDAAKALVAKWKTMVANEDSSDPEEEDEACVPDAPESYSDSPESPSRDDISGNNITRHNNEESKEISVTKSSKYGSSEYSSKSSSKGNTISEVIKSKSSDKNDSHKEKLSKTESKVHEQRHESISKKHSSKQDFDNDKSRGLKDLSQDSRKRHDSKDKNRFDSDVGRVSSSTESCEVNDKDNHRKRKQEKSGRDKESIKKKKYSESESEEDSSRLIMNSPVASEPESPTHTDPEMLDFLEPETLNKKNTHSCDKTLSRKETSEKEKRRSKEKSDAKQKSRSDVEKESSKPKDLKKDDKRKKESHSSSKHSSKSKTSHSSSSSKDRIKNNDTEQEKDKKYKREDKSKTGDSNENNKDQKLKKKIKKEKEAEIDGIDSQSGTSFAEALGMCTMPPPSRKRGTYPTSSSLIKSVKVEPSTSTPSKIVVTPSATSKTEAPIVNSNSLSLLSPNVKLEPLSVDLAATLPEISPNYKPLAHNFNPVHRKVDEESALSEIMYCKAQRTKVFSGNKIGYTSVPTLYELCIRILIENIEGLEVTGGVPYYIIKPVLERATPDQLFLLEHYNPYLIEDTDPLWQFHCSREFRSRTREEMESWRDMYMRCLDEREAKLKTLTANIKQSIDKSQPVRSTIQVYDDHIKPPRNVLRKQAKYGTARDLPITSSQVKKKLISGSNQGNTTASCPPSPIPRLKATSSSIGKKTKAPLMAKALQLIKGRYRR